MGRLARPLQADRSTTRGENLRDLTEADEKVINRVEELAKKRGWKMSHVATAWLMQKGISSPIIGFSKIERLDEALEANGKELTDEEVKYLDEAYVPKAVIGHS